MVLNELLDHGLMPTKCSYTQNRQEIICCPSSPTQKPTSLPEPNRISAKSKQNVKYFTVQNENNYEDDLLFFLCPYLLA